jgi:hypothetical protein
LETYKPRKSSLGIMKKLLLPAILLFFTSLAGSVAEAEQNFDDLFDSNSANAGEPAHFSGDRFSYNLKTKVIEGGGGIEVVQGDTVLTGDSVRIDTATGIAEIQGNVELARPGDSVTGEKARYDFQKKEGIIYEARGRSVPWHVFADKIERESDGQYRIENSWLSTCDLPSPHYRFSAKTTTLIPDERVVARDLVLRAGPAPIFYLPYYSHRLDGGYPPLEWEAGTESDVGAYARIGYNLELGEALLLTPHVSGFTKSGIGVGLDGRLNLFDGAGRGEFGSFYISDGNDHNTDEPDVDRDRGAADLYYRQEMPHDLTALVQVEYISDAEYLKTFEFDDFSKREAPETFFNIERTTHGEVVSLIFRENLVDYTEQVERQPEFGIELLERRLWDTGLFFSATNEAAYLDDEETGFEAARNFTEARLKYPMRLWDKLGLVPFIEGTGTYYSKTLLEQDEYRLSWGGGVAAQSRVQKVYGSPFKRYSAFRHLIVPSIGYRYGETPDREPEELPGFDSIDQLDRKNAIEVEIRNYLQAKDSDGGIVDILEYNVTAGVELDDGADKLATLENELLWKPVPNWEVAVKAVHDLRDETRTDLVSGVIRYARPESFRASLGFLHEDIALEPHDTQVVYSFSKGLGPNWRVGIEQRYSVSEDDFTYNEVWLWRDLHCWELLLSLRDRRESTSVMALVNIKAFPLRKIERRTTLDPIGENHPWPTRW